MSDQVFDIIPAGNTSLWIIVPVLFILLGVAYLLVNALYYSKSSSVRVEGEGIEIRGGLYGRSISQADLQIDGGRLIDLNRPDAEGFRLARRTNGVGLPGYYSGWFRLRNGEKALAFITDTHRVLYLPTTQGYALMMSLEDPERFLEALRAID